VGAPGGFDGPVGRVSLVHPTGNPNARQAARALLDARLLHEVVTTLADHPRGLARRWLERLPGPVAAPLRRELARRSWDLGEFDRVRQHAWREVLRLSVRRFGLGGWPGFGRLGSIDWIGVALDRHAARRHLDGLDAVYAYEDAAAASFRAARQRGILCLYELPTLFHRASRAVAAQEAERFPELAASLQPLKEPAWKIERKDEELRLADHVFVPSEGVRQSLRQAPAAPDAISVIPYGAPVDELQPRPRGDAVFRALFVGRIAPLKGAHYLLEAWRRLSLGEAELVLVGSRELPRVWLERGGSAVSHIAPVPRAALAGHYRSASVFVFPSLVEGLPLVALEAMACGLPVVATREAVGSDLVQDGVEGFLVPSRDVEALAEKLEWCRTHPEGLAEMGRAARRRAEQQDWPHYRARLAERVQALLAKRAGRGPARAQ
jgi:glycosyltransferase involved in cell wall biosynthesis